MFRNPVFDLVVVVPALLIAGLLSLFIMAGRVRAAELPATTTAGAAVTASTSGTTLPDSAQRAMHIERGETHATSTLPAAAIRNAAQLKAYAAQALADDPAIASVTLSPRGVAVSYRKEGMLLGVLPVALPTRATVATDGTVTFSEPWYTLVTASERDRMRSALEVRVHALLTSEGYLPSMALSPATQAEILAIIQELVG